MTSWSREDALYIPQALATLSLLHLAGGKLWDSVKPNGKDEEAEEASMASDGLGVFIFRFVRLLTIVVLLSVEVYAVSIGQSSSASILQPVVYLYAGVLAILTIVAPMHWRDVASHHLNLVMFATFTVYAFLDVWPYATYYLQPLDSFDAVSGVRITMLTLSGLVIPLVIPRSFRPSTPDAKPSIEDTASLLSFYTFSFLDNIVFHANKAGNVTLEDMPELIEMDKIEHVGKRALPILDIGRNKKRHVALSVAIIWKKMLLLGLLWELLESLAQFGGPFGLKNLLEYLETGVSPHGLRPWVWIIVLTVGPGARAFFSVLYLYANTYYTVELTNSFTYLVFRHALRIRFKTEATDDSEKKESETPTVSEDTSSTVDVSSSAASTDATVVDAESNEDDDLAGIELAPPVEGQAKERGAHLSGKINNLLTTDLSTISGSFDIVIIPVGIFQLVLSSFYLYNILDWSALVGLAIIILLLPLPTYISKLMANIHKKKMETTDKRVQTTTEYLNILRMIKLFAWQDHTIENIEKIRDEELRHQKRSRIMQIALWKANDLMPVLSKSVVIAVYILLSKEEFRASRIFSAIMVFSMIQDKVSRVVFQLPSIIRNKVSFDRYTEFFNTTELLVEERVDQPEIQPDVVPAPEREEIIGFKSCSFSWDRSGKGKKKMSNTREHFELRFDEEITFKRDAINIIIGPTASGKTSVLMALLGEMYYEPHGPESWFNLPRAGGVAYAPQESWVLNDTIKENILFGESYDEDRYKQVLSYSALERDLGLWEAGDLTEVGEKGLTLSGGQKARVTLARALYSSASILLLDDVLAALDVHTAKWIVNKAFSSDLVKGRTVILITHNIALTAPIAEFVLVLGRNGKVLSSGNVDDVLKSNSKLSSLLEKEQVELEEDVETKLEEIDEDVAKGTAEEGKAAAGKLVIAEEKAVGRVNSASFMLFVRSMGGAGVWIIMFISINMGNILILFQGWFLGYWSEQYSVPPPSEVPTVMFLIIYIAANFAGPLTDGVADVLWVLRGIKAAKTIHSKLLNSIFSSTFRWLDVTPTGRIITRCTQDISSIDGMFPAFLINTLFVASYCSLTFVVSIWMVGLYALVPGALVLALGTILSSIYLKCQVSIKREVSNAKAPVVSQTGAAISGLPSIRAYGAQEKFDAELCKRINKSIRASLTFYHINRWVSVRMDLLGVFFSGIISAYMVYGGRLEAGFAGFTINTAMSFTGTILALVRFYNIVEIEANSLERINDYLVIDHEEPPSESRKPPAYWPASGELRVENLSARYSDDSPEVLKDVSFSAKSGERIGIVGRTGAGKSSIALALLRALKTSGKVYYDGIATDEINLDALRSKITLIPQQPELMHGTLRENLDPFGQHDDALLNDSLRSAGLYSVKELAMKEVVDAPVESEGTASKSEETKIGLDTLVENGGKNFSLGQRQIIALARAIVRRSKLLILDEATASIDYATDVAIQKTLRTEFSRDTTILTIAHRLQTIIDYDKILVLDAGKVVEFDSPKALLGQERGYFHSLVEESDEKELLYKLAHA